MDYVLHLCILICVYTILAQSLGLVAGFTGQISLAHAGFYGIGAYSTAILSINFEFSILLSLLCAMLVSGLVAYSVSKVATKTIDDFYIIITLAVQLVIFSVLKNWKEVTGGPLGISGVPPLNLFGLEFDSKVSILFISVLLVIIIWVVLRCLTLAPFGRILRALSEDEIYVSSLGKNVRQYKVTSFVISGVLASIAGVLYAHYISYIDPSSFTVDESIVILSILILGGMRNLQGVLFAAVFLVLLPELLRFIGMPSNISANMKQVFYGFVLVAVIFRMNNKKINTFVT